MRPPCMLVDIPRHKHGFSRPIGGSYSILSKSGWKVDFALLSFKPFTNGINFGMCLLYYINHIWSSPIYINIWAIMHIDTHFLELEYFNYDNVKPSKNIFFFM